MSLLIVLFVASSYKFLDNFKRANILLIIKGDRVRSFFFMSKSDRQLGSRE